MTDSIRKVAACVAGLLFLLLTGCNDKLNLEDSTVPLGLGLDIVDDKLHFYVSAPVFSKEAKKKSSEAEGAVRGLRESRSLLDAQLPGAVASRNYQVIMIGKEMLRHDGWFIMLDAFFRDPRNTTTVRMIAVDGPVSEYIYTKTKDRPMDGFFLRGLVDTSSRMAETVKTTLQELHRQLDDKAMTPAIAEVKIKNGKIMLKGTALLSQKGRYETSLNYQETALLQLLRRDARAGVSLSYPFPGVSKTGLFDTEYVSFSLGAHSVKIRPSYENGRFRFKIKVKSVIVVTEKLFEYDLWKKHKEFADKLEEPMKAQIEELLAKCRQHKIDPVGFGLYARAYEYSHYKEVQDRWGDEFSRADFDVSVDLRIASPGAVQ
ncbi:Ger(x)C family spore germination protein [Paenibacillus sp. M1]|uniref:Ger(X)C family spore germination protein n=1 Tax=Paenibacillus haidiansis TaxID=1574488 RepID=A0ABU7VUV7_9BACL